MRRTRGFTLIEILVALTLLAAVGGTLLQLFYSGLKTARIADERSQAALLARSLLSELQVYATHEAGMRSGEFDDGFRWQAILEPTNNASSDEDAPMHPLDLTLRIDWGSDTDPQIFELHSLLISQVPPS